MVRNRPFLNACIFQLIACSATPPAPIVQSKKTAPPISTKPAPVTISPNFACFAHDGGALAITRSGSDLTFFASPTKQLASKTKTTTAPPPPVIKPDAKQTARIRTMMKSVAAARSLKSTREVPGITLTRPQLIARLRAHVDKEIPPAAIANEAAFNSLMGLVPKDFDYESAMYGLLEAQLAGYYEPEVGQMFLAGDLDEDTALATLAHELVHALQDQHFDLKGRMKYEPGKSDSQTALQCLAEGDATSAMFDVMIAKMPAAAGKTVLDVPDAIFIDQVKAAMAVGPGSDAPRVMRDGLAAPYVDGLIFVNGLRRRGGWAEVDRAWGRLPKTTEQVLHIDKWDADEAAIEVHAPTANGLGDGWSIADSDSMGELGVRIVFGEWMKSSEAAKAAANWGGDQVVLLRRGDMAAMTWRIRYDAAPVDESVGPDDVNAYARNAFTRVRSGLIRTHGEPVADATDGACADLKTWSIAAEIKR